MFSSSHQICLVKYSGFDGLLCFSLKVILSSLYSMINDLVLFTGDIIFLMFQNKEATKEWITRPIFLTPSYTSMCFYYASLKNIHILTHTKFPLLAKYYLWWKRKPCTYLKVLMATVFLGQSVAKTDPAFQLIFLHRTSREHTYSFQRFLNNLGQDWLLSNKDLIQHLQTLPPSLQILPHKL